MNKTHNSANTSSIRPTYLAILEAENSVLLLTHEKYGKGFNIFAEAIDVLLSLSYVQCTVPKDQQSNEYQFHVHIRHFYYGIPNSLRSCIVLAERGHYDDAFNCLRSVLEGLVKYKYLLKNKDKIIAYETDGKDAAGKKVRISRAFEESCGPGVQEKAYRLGSQFEHKNFAAGLPLLRALLNKEQKYSLVPVFQQQLCEGAINYLTYLFFGFLNLAEHFFSFQWPAENEKLLFENMKKRFAKIILARRAQFPASLEWSSAMDKVVCVNASELEIV
ncbi:MAG: hypothetical protein HYX48_00980 [Chlamydiales bacterium]|nr:hypothetical protein [Chlamydiales bacterium]